MNLSYGNPTLTGVGELSRAIREIARTAFRSQGFTSERKKEIALQLEFLVAEAAQPQEKRKAAIIKPVLDGLRLVLSTTADMLQAWNQWGPTLVQFFNHPQEGEL